MSSKKGILYERLPSVDGRRGWYEGREGDEEKDKEGYPKYNKYEGEIENGKPNGNGTCTLINGASYVGKFVDGLRERDLGFHLVYSCTRLWRGLSM